MTRKWKILIGIGIGILVLIHIIALHPQDAVYLFNMKRQLVSLSRDKTATARRVAAMKKDGSWADGRVGITKDGYVFYYVIHESHGMDTVSDIHLLYLPDEKRFLMNHEHFCHDLNKFDQLQNKAKVMALFR